MAQQPNIEIGPEDLPRVGPDTAPARRWLPTSKPGVISSPSQVPSGGSFGTPGPDTGWAYRIVRTLEPDIDRNLEAVLVALMAARAAAAGRAPMAQDLEVAKVLTGVVDGAPQWVVEQGRRWQEQVPWERSKGSTAADEVDQALLTESPERIRVALANAR
jgi:hypothetical protein